MTTESPSRQLKVGLVAIITLSIVAGVLGMVAFAEWLHSDSSYLLHGAVAALFLGVIVIYSHTDCPASLDACFPHPSGPVTHDTAFQWGSSHEPEEFIIFRRVRSLCGQLKWELVVEHAGSGWIVFGARPRSDAQPWIRSSRKPPQDKGAEPDRWFGVEGLLCGLSAMARMD